MTSVKSEIITKATKLGADLIGIAAAEELDHAPTEHKATDIMPKAKSIIVLAMRCLNGPIKNNHWPSYTVVHEGNDARLNNIAYFLSCYIEENYHANAIPIPANAPYYHWDQDSQYGAGDLSHKHAAVVAGLGIIGKNSLLITPQYGNKVNLVSIITDICIEPDALLSEELCPLDCRLCIDICPEKAIVNNSQILQTKCRNYCWTKLPKGFPVLRCWACRDVCSANKKRLSLPLLK